MCALFTILVLYYRYERGLEDGKNEAENTWRKERREIKKTWKKEEGKEGNLFIKTYIDTQHFAVKIDKQINKQINKYKKQIK